MPRAVAAEQVAHPRVRSTIRRLIELVTEKIQGEVAPTTPKLRQQIRELTRVLNAWLERA